MLAACRRSTHVRDARSNTVVVVKETRGTLYVLMSLFLAVLYFVFAIRDLFFCGHTLTSDPFENKMYEIFKDCDQDKLREGWSGLIGGYELMEGLVRLDSVMTENTADLYHTMMGLVLVDLLRLHILLRCGPDKIPFLNSSTIIVCLIYETYVLHLARRAYNLRKTISKMD